jgi:hypothetical protein
MLDGGRVEARGRSTLGGQQRRDGDRVRQLDAQRQSIVSGVNGWVSVDD